jgi:hypothetical protein
MGCRSKRGGPGRQRPGKVMTIPANAPACSTAAMIHNPAPGRDHAHRSGRCELCDQPAKQGVQPLWLGRDKRRRLNRSAEPKFRIHLSPAKSLRTPKPGEISTLSADPVPAAMPLACRSARDLAGLCARPPVQRIGRHPPWAYTGHERCLQRHPASQLSGIVGEFAGMGPRISIGRRCAAGGNHDPADTCAYRRGRATAGGITRIWGFGRDGANVAGRHHLVTCARQSCTTRSAKCQAVTVELNAQ